MRTTTVVWRRADPVGATEEQKLAWETKKQRLMNAAASLAGEQFKNEFWMEQDADGATLTIHRVWPDLAAAEAWVALSLEENAISAVVDPE